MKRIIPERVRAWLLTEMDLWRRENCLTDDQVRRILDLYESGGEGVARRRSGAIWLLLCLAALLAGIGVLLLVGYNWEYISDTMKLVILFGAILTTHTCGLFMRWYRPSEGRILSSERI
ncbi:MAG: DUF2157 domain-containing protein, partial [Planctomycetia bacterium]|nr:DUF2157 domain-containing protein [Planctomycetia bacterium]